MSLDANITAAIARNAERVRERIAHAAAGVGRDPSAVRLVAVSKKFDAEHARAAVIAGLTDLGENRVQEAIQKMGAVNAEECPEVTWHLIGHLQSNKARKASQFAWIHSVDSVDLLQRLEDAAHDAGTSPRLLVQLDLAGEVTKHGATVDNMRRILDVAATCTAVRVRGLMVLPPWSEQAERARPFFVRLREIRDQCLEDGIDPSLLGELSMGMSHDLEIAVEEGATMVRVGTAIFGPRPR